MKKFLQILSCVLLLLNPACGFLCVGSIIYSCQTESYWWIPMFLITPIIISYVLKFHFYMYRVENFTRNRKYILWKREMSKTHYFIKTIYDDGDLIEHWQNKQTGLITEY